MAKKKGLSMEEKKARMLDQFKKKKEPFHYTEVEQFSLKAGISFGSIKEVLENVLADFLISSEKIGTSIYYWCFPSDPLKNVESQLSTQINKNKDLINQIDSLEKQIEIANSNREENEERDIIFKKYKELEKENKEKKEEVDNLNEYGIGVIKRIEKEGLALKNEINYYIDSIFVIKKWIKEKQPHLDDNAINKIFDIPEDLDYVD
jgi:hypothetical protein